MVAVTEPADRIISVARAEHDHALELLRIHLKFCTGCDNCDRLQAHVNRTQRQVELLEPEPVEDVPLW